jgi:hypothetical protein
MKEQKKLRGIFEKIPGSGIFWVEHYDADGKRHRELAGTKGTAIKLQAKRQADKLAQRKLPEMRRGKSILLQELIDDALEFSKQHHEDQRNVASRLKAISAALGSRSASSITPVDIKAFTEGEAFASDQQSLQGGNQPGVSCRHREWQGRIESRQDCQAAQRGQRSHPASV